MSEHLSVLQDKEVIRIRDSLFASAEAQGAPPGEIDGDALISLIRDYVRMKDKR